MSEELEHSAAAPVARGVCALSEARRGSSSCGAAHWFGLRGPFWKRMPVRMTYMLILRNSDSQFSNVASTKALVPRYSWMLFARLSVGQLVLAVAARPAEDHAAEKQREQPMLASSSPCSMTHLLMVLPVSAACRSCESSVSAAPPRGPAAVVLREQRSAAAPARPAARRRRSPLPSGLG